MRRYSSVIWAGAAIGVSLFLSAPSSLAKGKSKDWGTAGFTKYVTIPGATRVGPEACAACHESLNGSYRHAFHAQQGVECEDCHGAGSLHIEGKGDIAKIVSFRGRAPRDANGACLSCHAQDERTRNWMAGAHAANAVRCTDCHQVHSPDPRSNHALRLNFDTTGPGRSTAVQDLVPESKVMIQPRWQKNDACLKCHQRQRGEMSLPYHHPLREGKVTCDDCHDPHGGAGRHNLRAASINQLCLSCHAQYRGPFMYQHPPVMENCLTCHTPHGSPNPNLVNVSQPALCMQCHAGHHNGNGLPLVDRCTNCHVSVHGSDVPSATGGSVFVDKGPMGAPGSLPASLGARAFLRGAGFPLGARMLPITELFSAFPGMSGAAFVPGTGGAQQPDTYTGFSFFPGAYRFLDATGFTGRVGQYDSLQQSAGADAELAYVSVPRRLSSVTRANVLTADDYRVTSQFTVGETLQLGVDLRSFFQQQDNYPFYGTAISPDIVPDNQIPNGAVFGVKRRLGEASARVKLPDVPVRVFVKGSWQARAGHAQLAWLDMGGDAGCNYCHFVSQLQPVNYTTRTIGGGAEVKLGSAVLTWEHTYSSFNDRLPFPTGTFGATLGPPFTADELPAGVPNTPAGTYYLVPPAPNQFSADTARLSWAASPELTINGDAGYTRLRNILTRAPQNAFDANAAVNWHPLERLRFTADYHQNNVLNRFTPLYTLYGNMSYHQHTEGLRAEYELTNHLDAEARYERRGITRSNSQLWPQFYSPDNTDLLYVVPDSASNTAGLALRYHGGKHLSARAGYDWTGTHNPGYLTVPGDNSRIFADVTLSPVSWLSFTNDTLIIVQNAFPVIQRRNRFYSDTAVASLTPAPSWNLELGYSYQQNNLATYMALQNDPGAGYILDAPLTPYKQLSQTYWVQSASSFFRQRLGFNARFTYNSARSGIQPDLNPNHYPAMADAVLFQQALGTLGLAAAQISQVIVPQSIGQAKLYYALPRRFDSGVIFSYGSYRDYLNPNLNGVLRVYSVYVGRSW